MFDREEVNATLALPETWRTELRARWLRLQELSVWGDLKSGQIGALPKLRKRVLDVGEKLRSVCNDRAWIPHPREQIKNALGSSLNLLDARKKLEETARDLDGGADLAAFQTELAALRDALDHVLGPRDQRLAALLDRQYGEDPEEE